MRTTAGSGERYRRPLQTAGIIVLFLIYFLHEFPEYLAGNVKYAAMTLLSLLLMAVLVCQCFEEVPLAVARVVARDSETTGKRMVLLVMAGLASLTHFNSFLLDHHVYVHARIVSPPMSLWNVGLWTVMASAAFMLLVRVPKTYTRILALALLWGVALRLLVFKVVPFDPEAADMLFAVDRSCDALLRGINPYGQMYAMNPSHTLWLIYFPLLWLPYVPFKALSLDLRWFNLLAQLGLFAFVWYLIGRRNRSALRALIFVVLLLLPDMIWSFFYRELSHYWLLGAVFVWLVWRERWRLSLLAVSGLLLMRITALTALWVYLFYVWKRRGLGTAIAHGAIAGAVFLIFMAPFAGVGLGHFKYLFFDSFLEKSAQAGWQLPMAALSFGGVLEIAHMTRWIMPLQVAGLLAIGLAYRVSHDTSRRRFVTVAAFAYGYFLWLSAFAFIYYWILPIVLLSTLYLIESRETEFSNSPALIESANVPGKADAAGDGPMAVAGERSGAPAPTTGGATRQ